MADVDTSEQIDCLNKHKGKAEQDKAGTERDMQEARQGLDKADSGVGRSQQAD